MSYYIMNVIYTHRMLYQATFNLCVSWLYRRDHLRVQTRQNKIYCDYNIVALYCYQSLENLRLKSVYWKTSLFREKKKIVSNFDGKLFWILTRQEHFSCFHQRVSSLRLKYAGSCRKSDRWRYVLTPAGDAICPVFLQLSKKTLI